MHFESILLKPIHHSYYGMVQENPIFLPVLGVEDIQGKCILFTDKRRNVQKLVRISCLFSRMSMKCEKKLTIANRS